MSKQRNLHGTRTGSGDPRYDLDDTIDEYILVVDEDSGTAYSGHASGGSGHLLDDVNAFLDNEEAESSQTRLYPGFILWQPPHDPAQNSTWAKAAAWLREVADMLERKGASYGNSAGEPLQFFSDATPADGLRVRLDDKLKRIICGSEYPGDDTVDDLLGYLALLVAVEGKEAVAMSLRKRFGNG